MKKFEVKKNEKGAALAITLLVMVILLGFAALALSRAASEVSISASDSTESRTFSAAEAALEDTTREFATLVENKLVITPDDAGKLEGKEVPYFNDGKYTFAKKIKQIGTSKVVTQTKGQFQGLVSLRDEWQITVTAKDTNSKVETEVRRRFFNDRIPIFQFGAFYQDDLEVNDPPLFIFNGRIHTNGNFFTNSNGSDIRYKSKITIAGELVRDRWKTGAALTTSEQSNRVYALDTADTDKQIPVGNGSVTCTSGTGGILKDITRRGFPYPKCTANNTWTTFSKSFEGNVVTHSKQLNLPINRSGNDLIEMIRRGKNAGDMENAGGTVKKVTEASQDSGLVSKERFANKEGLRISLADSRDKLPQCAEVLVAVPCGVRLDAPLGTSLGYQPKSLRNVTYKTTPLNGNRLAINNREVWIKIELVSFNAETQKPETKDVTEDILSLGVTEPIITSGSPSDLQVKGYTSDTDSRSIVKLQRFAVEGEPIGEPSGENYKYGVTIGTKKYNFVTRIKGCKKDGTSNCTSDANFASPIGSSTVNNDETYHYQLASFNGHINTDDKDKYKIVPFPIQLQDTREGNRANSTTNLSASYVFRNGVMSLVDIDVANLRRFLKGDFNNNLPLDTPFAIKNSGQSLKSTDVPSNRGWVIYFSDRRGDEDFDGRYKMEDVNPNYDSNIDEDLDNNGTLDKPSSSNKEAPPEDSTVGAGYAAVTDHSYYRRGVRLINGKTLPGNYDSTTPSTTTGFTLASENGVYVWGDYNVQSVTVAGGTSSTTSDKYSPQGKTAQLAGTTDGNLHIPAAVIGDAVTVLSNNWQDANSFAFPNDLSKRLATDTRVRFAMLAGDPITGRSPDDGLYGSQNGGLINFKRFLESWSSDRLNYSGSLVNLYNAFNNNGRHKPNFATYNPPIRDWTFEESFKDPNRLPPGTPFVYFITFTGFERVNE